MHPATRKNRDIEVLRAVAIAYVMVSHWAPHALARAQGLGDWFESHTGLWSGVDLFFAVSGFVITRSLLREHPHGGGFWGAARPFWVRRIFRLWPSAWLWAAITVSLSYGMNATGLFGVPTQTAWDAVMAALNLANLHEFACLVANDCGALRIYWSLSLEEQFYWLFPFAVFLLPRKMLIALLAVLALSQLFLVRPMAFMTQSPDLAWLIRSDAICLGALTALAVGTPAYDAIRAVAKRHRAATGLLTMFLLGVLASAGGSAFDVRLATGLLALVSASLVWLASYDAHLIFPRLPALEPLLMWCGARSYALYLVHDFANSLAAEWRARVPMPLSGVAWGVYSLSLTVGLTVILAELSYRYVESPMRRRGRELARGHTIWRVPAAKDG